MMRMRIRLVGLGPGGKEGISEQALAALRSASAVLVRTSVHPGVEDLAGVGVSFASADDLYDQAESFDELYSRIADRVVELARAHGDVAFAVPGHPLFGERATGEVLRRAREAGIPVEVVAGKDFVTATLEALGEPFDGHLQVLNAYDLAGVRVDPRAACLVYQLDCESIASEAKLALMRAFPDDHPIRLVVDGGNPEDESIVELALFELDRRSLGPRTTAYLPALDAERPAGFYGLVDVVARLRGPGGCPWDIKQTHETLKTYLLEETYEVLDAIDSGDADRLCEELGDFLLQALMHAQIDSEQGLYDIDDVVAGQTEKLLRRHPHVFGDREVSGVEEVLHNWEMIKAEEKGREPVSALDSVPKSLPALLAAYEVSKRAARLGFDWPSLPDVLDKVAEELAELREAVRADNPNRVRSETADLLFAVANAARVAGLQPEETLRAMVRRFAARFREMERELREQGRDPGSLTPEEWEELWVRAKRSNG
jgi:tetrapyrrole methylase family protein/MazG family protein